MGAKIEKNVIWGQQCSQGITKIRFPQCASPLGEDFWLPQGTPKSTKNGTLGENGGPRAVIFSIFAEKGAATHFFIDFSSIFDQKIDVFFVVFFQTYLLFFGHGDLHDSMAFSNRNLLFHFLFFCFFLQKMIKNQCKKPDEKKG